MARVSSIPQEKQEKVIACFQSGMLPDKIAAKLRLTYESVHWIALKNGLKCPRKYPPAEKKKVARWVNTEARYSGIPDYMV